MTPAFAAAISNQSASGYRGRVRFSVLGPLVAEDASGPVELKGPRHRAVLARLLLAGGRVVPVDRLVDDLWEGEPPDGAVGALQTFIAALRRALEPDRPPRTPARLLVTSPPGYALRVDPDDVDARRFEAAVHESSSLEASTALAGLDAALALWRGPAYAEFADAGWAKAEIRRLDELHLLAGERRAEALLALGRAAEVIPDLDAQVKAEPWRENGWRLLALALYRVGRQSDALAALRQARQALAGEFGLDPGPELRQLESDVLAQAPRLSLAPPNALPPGPTPTGAAIGAADGPRLGRRELVGREEELAQLEAAAGSSLAGPRLGLVLLSGDAGAGKTALAETFTARAAAQGWKVAWGTNPDDAGLPAAWPWDQILRALDASVPQDPAETDPVVARFRWHRAVAARLGEIAARTPLMLVLDDLHWAGAETLALLTALVTEPAREPILLLATYRTTDVATPLADFLGRAARAEPSRIYLGGLSPTAVADLVRSTIGRPAGAATAATISQRSGGNPFFVRELARLYAAHGTLDGVPPGVRDVVRYRVARLPEPVQAVLRRATVLGLDVDLELLAPVDLDAVENAVERGFLVERGPRQFQFVHALVRDTLYGDVSRSRRARWHAELAERLERLHPDDVDALAHHYLQAETQATAQKAARYARKAAEQAQRRFDPHAAAKLWQAALTAYERSGSRDRAEQLALTMGLVRALAVIGGLDRARRHRAGALDLAETLGDPLLTAQVISAFDVPAIWTDNDDPALAQRIVALTEQTLAELPPGHTAVRSRLFATLALELRSMGGNRAREAAYEAERLARRLEDPSVLAFALNALFMQSFERAGMAEERAAIGEELVDLAAKHRLVSFEILGHLILIQAHSARADFDAADRSAAAADRLGDAYQIPLVSVFTRWYRALRTSLTGTQGEAEAAYRAAAARLTGTGMAGLDSGVLGLALLCDALRRGDTDLPDVSFGRYEPWCRPLVELAVTGKIPDSPHDLLLEARLALHALVAIKHDDRAAMERCYAALLPAKDELAGAGSGLLTLRPVAYYLDELAQRLRASPA
jgi:DNA-binding SARP family transcriptional activator